MKKFMSINEVCQESGLSQRFVRQMVKEEKLPYIKSGTKVLINYALASEIFDEMSESHE